MLETLNGIDKGRAQRVVAQLIKEFLPNAFPDAEVKRDELYAAIREEVLVSLGLENQNLDDEAITKVLALLNDEANSLSIDNEGKDQAKKRLGQKGDLSNFQYKIEFEPHNRYPFEDIGITRAEVENVIRNPDKYTHLLRGKTAEESEAPLSLYVKTGECNNERASILVEAVRHQDVLAISAAFRIFMDDIKGSEDDSALEILEKFVATYGIETKVGDSPWEKLHLYNSILLSKPGPISYNDIARLIQPRSNRRNDDVIMYQQIRVSELNVIEVAVLYAISMSTYCDALRGHGLDIKEYS